MANIDNAFPIPDGLSLSDNVGIFQGSNDPTVGAGETAPQGSLFLRTTGQLYIKVGPADLNWTEILSGTTIGVGLNNASTGLLSGGTLTINGNDNTKFDIAAGVGIIVDNHTNPLSPTAQLISWATQIGIVTTNISTADRTFIAVNNSGSLVQSTSIYTNTEHRTYINIGALGHANRTNILQTRNNPDAAFDVGARLGDLARAIGPINISGNAFFANGPNLFLDKSAGVTYRTGQNFQLSKSDPDTTYDIPLTVVSFRYSYRNGIGGYNLSAAINTIDPSQWDDGSGTLAAVPNGRFTVQQVVFFAGTNEVRIEYGQQIFSNLSAAHANIPDPNFESNPAFSEGVTRAYIIISGNTTDLTNTSDSLIVSGAKFGNTTSAGPTNTSVSLQQAYLNSVTPEIVTIAPLGALSVKEGVGVGGNLVEGYNSSNVLTFSISAIGNVSLLGTVDGRDVSVDGITLDNTVTEVNNIELSLGTSVSTSGTWVGFVGTNYLNSSTSTTNSLTILDQKMLLALTDTLIARHNGNVTQTFSTTPTSLLFNTNIRTDSNYVYNSGITTVTNNGTYLISFEAAYVSTSSSVTSCQTSIYINGSILPGANSFSNHSATTSGQQTTTGTIIVSLSATNTIQIVGVRTSGSGSLVSQANGCRLTVFKLR